MLKPLLNRDGVKGDFELPTDGWFQLAPEGRFPVVADDPKTGKPVRLVQVIDGAATAAICADFANRACTTGMLVDYDHFSLDTDKSSEAAGWIEALEARPTEGLWGRIRWTNRGAESVQGGAFRFLSPTFDRGTLEDLGGGQVRPRAMVNAGLTNDPNLKGIRPLTNRSQSPFGSVGTVPAEARGASHSGHDAAQEKEHAMKERLTTLLGLAPDAAEEAVVAGVEALRNRAQDRDALATKVATLEASALEAQVEQDLTEFAGVIEDRAEVKAQLVANRESGLKLLRALRQVAAVVAPPGAAGAVPNRKSAMVPSDDPASDGKAGQRAAAIRNRAAEIEKGQKVSYQRAWQLASAEVM